VRHLREVLAVVACPLLEQRFQRYGAHADLADALRSAGVIIRRRAIERAREAAKSSSAGPRLGVVVSLAASAARRCRETIGWTRSASRRFEPRILQRRCRAGEGGLP